MIPSQHFEQHASKFIEPELPMSTRFQLATEIRDSLEVLHSPEYLNFLKCYFRVFYEVLINQTKPQSTDSVENKVRNIIVEILNRLPHSEVLRPFVQDLFRLAMAVLTTDNEENGLVCIRIVFDLLRNFRNTLECEVQPFLNFVQKIYENFKATVNYFFDESHGNDNNQMSVSHPMGFAGSQRPPGGPVPGQLNPSTRSFKILTECPLIVMYLFQLYSQYVQVNIPVLLPLMVNAISIPGPAHVPPNMKNHYAELKGAQVKTVSFLTYLLKSFADSIKQHEDNICQSIVNLLVTCPDSVSIRKELLIATRHVLSTDFKRGFYPLIDTLLEERVLVGTGRACYETLRPLAYSILAELIHHVRLDLSLVQLSCIIYLFSRNMHDASLPVSVQTTCARLMLNLVEVIFSKGEDPSCKEEGRSLLVRILDAFVSKFGTFKRTIPQLLEDCEDGKEHCSLRSKLELPVQAALNLQMPLEHSKELSDGKQLIKTLVMGMKTLVWGITHVSLPQNQIHVAQQSNVSIPVGLKGMREEEVQLASGVLKSGVLCLSIFKEKDEEREMLQHFSQIFVVMEPRNLMDIFSMRMHDLFEYMLNNNQLSFIFSTLLQQPKIVRYFADVLVNFLVSNKLDVLRQPDTPEAKLVLHMFRHLFHAIVFSSKLSPADCERVLQPHISTIMEICMKNATEIERPHGYLHLLRAMFRGLSEAKYELLFREFIHHLSSCLNMLLAMVEGPNGVDTRDLVIELCLTLPARLSSLLPHLPRLMRPLVMALKGSDELIELGLKTLEFWIDSLTPDFLDPSMANVMSEIILTLWSHVRPKPYRWGEKSLQLLGKLGGRNRRFLKEPLALECKENPEHGLRLILTFEPATSFLVPFDRCIYLAIAGVMQNQTGMDSYYRRHALKLLRVCLSSVLNLKGNISGEGITSGHLSMVLMSSIDPARRRTEPSTMKVDLGVKTKTQLLAEKSVFKVLLMTVIAANAEPDLQDPKDDFVSNICRHFAMLFHVEASVIAPAATNHVGGMVASTSGLNSKGKTPPHTNLKELDPLIFLDALIDVLASENRAHAKEALNALNIFAESLLFLARCKHAGVLTTRGVATPGTPMMVSSPSMNPVYSPPPSVRIPVFEQLLPRLLHCCYGSTWQAQMGGVMGLGALVGKATVETLCLFQVKVVRALVYVLKRLPQHANKEQEETSQVLTQVLRVVNNVDEANSEHRRQSFQGVVEFLAAELFNPNATHVVRKNVQSCLALLASRTGSEVSELLEPLYQPLLQPLIARPLRSKLAEQQVGTVMALNFCLALRPPLLKLTPELVNILQEALQNAESDETVMIGKYMNPKIAVTLTKLRTACIELLCTAMSWADFKNSSYQELRSRIISMFFKSLTCRTPEIVAVAKEGLRQVVQQQKMPKDLLQSSLRPILVNLTNTRGLTMPLLQGLARLLELLSNWFNVTLGEKLLEHLKKWLEPEKLSQAQKSWKVGEEPKIAAAIIELFHLLPPTAGKFLEDLVSLTIKLEEALPQGQVYSELNSPYHLPLTKFLNRYASDAVDYFLARLHQPKYFTRFLAIIKSEEGQPLREELANSPEKIIAASFSQDVLKVEDVVCSSGTTSVSSGNDKVATSVSDGLAEGQPSAIGASEVADVHLQGLSLVSSLVKIMPDWLYNNRPVFDALVLLWKSSARHTHLQNERTLNLEQVKESKKLVKCFLNYLRHDRNEAGVLFDMLSIFLVRTRIDYTFLKEFYMIEVAEGYSPQMKKVLLVHFLDLFQSNGLAQDHLVVAMQMLILPMLVHAFQNGQGGEVVDPSIIQRIVEKLLDPPEEVSNEYSESLRIELLQLATLFLKYLPNELVHHRKELIKFGWNHLKRDDSASKQWAFVNVCHFLEAYQAPEKIILQVFLALLRTCQPENKVLVKQALDILIPALPRRLPSGDSKVPLWIRYTKKILVEEGHSVPNLIHIFQLIVRHSDLFYSCRAQFVPQMVNSLSRLGLPQNSPPENRRLAIELAGLVVSWEKQRQSETRAAIEAQAHSQSVDSAIPSSASGVDQTSSGTLSTKRLSDGSSFSEDLTKRVKIEGGPSSVGIMSPTGTTPSNVSTANQIDEEYKPNAAMEEMIINFLIRVALVTEPKDKELSAMYKQALNLLSQALEVWPTANIKFNYLEKLLTSLNPSGQSKDPSIALAQGLDVMNKVLAKQPHLFIRNNVQQITQLLEPCFNSKLSDIGKSLCTLLKMVFEAFPGDATNTPQDIRSLHSKVEELIQKHLATATAAQLSPDAASVNTMISFALSVIRTLAEGQKGFIDPFMASLVRVLQRLTREMGTISSAIAKQESSPAHLKSDLVAVTNNLTSILKLIGGRILHAQDGKRLIGQILQSEGTDGSVLLTVLDMIKDWIENDVRSSNSGTSNPFVNKDIMLYLQKLSQVDRQNPNLNGQFFEDWDKKYLQLLYHLCSDSSKYPLSVRQEVFQKVERQYMLGLRAKDPEMRQKFFCLYHESLGKTMFSRLQYIIQTQEWEALSDFFWLKQGLDLLLAILVEQEPITLAPNSAQVPPLMVNAALPERTAVQQVSEIIEEGDGAPSTFMGLVNKHVKFLNETSKLQVADLVYPLRELAQIDANVAYHMWVLVFPIVWATLRKEEQITLAKPVITLLSKDYHSKQKDKRPNVVQALLEGLSLCQPQPKIPSELIKFLGKTYNAWHIAVSLLESHVMIFLNEPRCSESLAELYRMLNEEDVRYGLWKRRQITAETKAGLSLVQHGYWQRAQDLFYQAMSKATQGTYNNSVPKAEMCLWEEQWLSCARQLSQWDVLVDFGKSVENYEILLDCLWKVPDWAALKELLPKAQVEDTAKHCIIQAFLSLQEGTLPGVSEAENKYAAAVDLALSQWWQLPEMSVQSHITLLQQFQQLVEIQESAKVLVEITNGSKHAGTGSLGGMQSGYVDLKDILETWRLRTPNEWDNLSVWYDLLQWRNHMYNNVINAFKDFLSSNPQLHQLGYRDKAWSVNKLAHVARKQGLYDVCVNILNKMYGFPQMEVQEAFVKIKEQAKAYLEMRGELRTGINMIDSTNLEYFPVQNKAEIFRLKGEFCQKMGDGEGANQAYSSAINLSRQFPKGWISWGNYCDQVFKDTKEEIWLEYAVSCFLQGIKYGVLNARNQLARVLYLLSFDTPSETVGKVFDKYIDQIAHWVWLPWIPQLLLSLQRPEATHCKLVLLKIATVYPQALYYWLRTYLLERRDIANRAELGRSTVASQQRTQQLGTSGASSASVESSQTSSHQASDGMHNQIQQSGQLNGSHDASSSQGQDGDRVQASDGNLPNNSESHPSAAPLNDSQTGVRRHQGLIWGASAVAAFDAAKDVMEALRNKHPNLASELEIFLTEIGSRFVPLPEERLLAVVHALLHRCYKYPTATTADVPQALKKELSGVCRACFSTDTVSKHIDFVNEYKRDFERDLDPENASFPSTLSELTERLKHWKNVLQSNVEDRLPAVLKLEEESKALREFHVVDIEVPGQYFADQEIAPDHTVKLDRIGADVPIVRRHGSSFRRLTLVGSDGSQKHFLVQTSLTPSARSDERMVQLFRVLNRLFDKHKESRRRHLALHTPTIIPVWPQVRMVEDDLMYSTFGEVYEINCARFGREADLPITYFKERLNKAITGQLSHDAISEIRLHTYNEITTTYVSENVFSQYMYKTLPSCNHLWTFKKQFAVQLALSGFMSYMLQIGGRSPNKILFAKNTGKVFQNDFHPAYDANGMIEFNEPVPFRLTRNLQTFFTPFGVEGLFVSAMCTAAQSVVAPKSQHIQHHLAMFFRDELLSWSWRRPPGMPSAPAVSGGINPAEFEQKVTANVEHVLGRIKGISPQSIPEEDENCTEPPLSVQHGVVELVEAALRPKNLCMMDPTWHPWF